MPETKLKEGTKVFTTDGKEAGKINRFVIDPKTRETTHVVIQKGWLLTEDKVVPFKKIRSISDEKVVLDESIEDFDRLPPFKERHFVQAVDQDSMRSGEDGYENLPAYYWYPPRGYIGFPAYGLGAQAWPPMETTQNIPENTVAIREGTDVISSDGKHVGDIEQVFIPPDSNKATHFLISQGILFKDRKLVPAQWISSATENEVHLTVSADTLESLPPYEQS